MPQQEALTPLVETYRFWDVVTLWGRDRLEHEDIVARVLAGAVIQDGLKLQSVDPRWVKGNDQSMDFRGYPYVGFRAHPNAEMCVIRAQALEHLLAIFQRGEQPSREQFAEEFISREDFRKWAMAKNVALPRFWFG